MRSLKNYGYVFDKETCIWARPGYVGIDYSDGEDIESRIANIIRKAQDKSVHSRELAGQCVDWPTRYHLSSQRANILRPFSGWLKGKVLEIGAGCGAITRYLGECGGQVLALEGSIKRAAITALRVHDLNNVTVVAEQFNQFSYDESFDVITLIGVLEYASIFNSASEPALDMLKKIFSLLAPEGCLIIAIENQLGLKYFAGAVEDHIGLPMYGIEDHYRHGEPQTYGKKVLSSLLADAGFRAIDFFVPFPDYKLPISIITPFGLMAEQDFDVSSLALVTTTHDPQHPTSPYFSLELAWSTAIKNGLASDLANSFLIVAKKGEHPPFYPRVLAYNYSTERRAEFCKEICFMRTEQDEIVVRTSPLVSGMPSKREDSALGLCWSLCSETRYYTGHLLAREFIQIVTRPGWDIKEVATFLRRYITFLHQMLEREGISGKPIDKKDLLPGDYLDAIPSNIIVTENDTAVIIDKEWQLKEGLELGYLVFRALISLIGLVSKFAPPAPNGPITRGMLVKGTLNELGLNIVNEDFSRYLEIESRLSVFSTGLDQRTFSTWSPEVNLPGLELTANIVTLNQRLFHAEQAKDFAEQLALQRLAKLEELRQQLALTQNAKDEAERLALQRLAKLEELRQQLALTQNAKDEAERLALQRLAELEELQQRLALAQNAENAAESRVSELEAQLDTNQSSAIWRLATKFGLNPVKGRKPRE